MNQLSLLSPSEVQSHFAQVVQSKRKQMKLSRQALAERSTVPASTIKKFETSGQISLRQFILLWQCVDSLEHLLAIIDQPQSHLRTIDEVLQR